jgi:hypothetical protein
MWNWERYVLNSSLLSKCLAIAKDVRGSEISWLVVASHSGQSAHNGACTASDLSVMVSAHWLQLWRRWKERLGLGCDGMGWCGCLERSGCRVVLKIKLCLFARG